MIRGVIEAENGAIEHYQRIIEFCDGFDFVTQDMVIDIQRDEQGHKRLFEGFLREYEAERARIGAPIRAGPESCWLQQVRDLGIEKTDGPRFTGARRLREERLLCCFLPA